ncbi:hypothetical protein A2935_03965 [Candidatus Wolfebacteria bacterium RIFCSPLOWO2_01_FULL_47_17b]|uniref:LamG-like jellyroll fold domain-containing protein n=1 Tax=Candidatus Wolfebacteria bacterium RIFCSPLOWO2_01_FULL_47_17b TaxID=1802558 RepID=A0A1F8DVL0_9BACT|nr:MAG: hypothetical protein A2935_03965 [Candidatus Wolfebacteria bacterium RIFCSPLOWO2_01_FULL_47_17b]
MFRRWLRRLYTTIPEAQLRSFRRLSLGNKSFTLIELLIVIGILAILTAAVVVILNPAELLRQARDSQRLQELSSLSDSIQLLETQVANLTLGTSTWVYVSIPDSDAQCANLGLPTLPSGYTYACSTEANYRNIDGSGWIPIDFTQGSGIISLPTLPIDPTNATSTGLYYTYIPGGSFEVTAVLESEKQRAMTDTDGGDSFSLFEAGSNKTLSPFSDSGLVGYWPFDEGSGTTANDSSGNNNTGALTNGPTWQSNFNCKVGGCLSFDGSDDYVSAGNLGISQNGEATIMGWFNFVQMAASKGDSIGLFTNIYQHSANNLLYLPPGSDYFPSSGVISANLWFHIALAYDGNSSTGILYINGILHPIGIQTSDNMAALTNFLVGYSSSPFYGSIDETRVYNRTLSTSEIMMIYNATR